MPEKLRVPNLAARWWKEAGKVGLGTHNGAVVICTLDVKLRIEQQRVKNKIETIEIMRPFYPGFTIAVDAFV